jgi:transcription factor SFP1
MSHWFRSKPVKQPHAAGITIREPSILSSHSSDYGTFIDEEDSRSNLSSPSISDPPTPESNTSNDRFTMPMTSPIDIATPTRNASSSPSSQGKKSNYNDPDSRASAMMSGTAFDSSMGRGRQDSFAGAKPISMNNPNRNQDGRPRRESLAGSLVGGMSWGGVSVGSWIRDE